MKPFVIYTAIVEGYDNILQPLVVDDRFDYYLFTNDIQEKNIGVWQVRPIPYQNEMQTKVARWVKTHPETLLPEYLYSMWVDANIQIRTPEVYERIVRLAGNGVLFASMWHHERDCIYGEAVELLASSVEHERVVYRWIRHLLSEGYPRHNGLYETGVMYRRHGDPRVKAVDTLWWDCIESHSKRDQLSFNYALWRNRLHCEYFLREGENARNSECFKYILHNNYALVAPNKRDDPFLNYYIKCNDNLDKEFLAEFHSKHLFNRSGYCALTLLGQYYRLKYFINH